MRSLWLLVGITFAFPVAYGSYYKGKLDGFNERRQFEVQMNRLYKRPKSTKKY